MDETFLRRAIDLAGIGGERGDGGPFGAVIVRQGIVIAEAWNRVLIDNDPTAHAEIVALRAAGAKLKRFHLSDCVLYASSEPCPMCLAAAYWARVERIVFANLRREAAAIGFCDAALYEEFRLPAGERRIPSRHLPLPGADEPLKRWRDNSEHIPY
ncbi:MAG: nucleoside deaminase [Betaproteobacteria bacterium]